MHRRRRLCPPQVPLRPPHEVSRPSDMLHASCAPPFRATCGKVAESMSIAFSGEAEPVMASTSSRLGRKRSTPVQALVIDQRSVPARIERDAEASVFCQTDKCRDFMERCIFGDVQVLSFSQFGASCSVEGMAAPARRVRNARSASMTAATVTCGPRRRNVRQNADPHHLPGFVCLHRKKARRFQASPQERPYYRHGSYGQPK